MKKKKISDKSDRVTKKHKTRILQHTQNKKNPDTNTTKKFQKKKIQKQPQTFKFSSKTNETKKKRKEKQKITK